mmetsp:Transcript_24580/g.20929  ORF Transcript_24580/g.20929 Transcript_24580/m.20929 type:complete len:137 (+) Transcript_24580:3-413(+)
MRLAMLCFGITNYLIAVATGILDNSVEAYYAIGAEWKMLAIIWGVGGIPGILCYLIHWLRVGKIELFWSHNPTDTPNITWGTKALTLIGGLGLGVSMSLMKKAFVFTLPIALYRTSNVVEANASIDRIANKKPKVS